MQINLALVISLTASTAMHALIFLHPGDEMIAFTAPDDAASHFSVNLIEPTKSTHKEDIITEPAIDTISSPVKANSAISVSVQQTTDLKNAESTDSELLAVHARSKVLAEVQTNISRHFYYPILARRNGWQGHVLLGFVVESNGEITQVRVAKGSGHPILDQSALTALRNVHSLPEAQEWLDGNRLELQLPVEYRLTGG